MNTMSLKFQIRLELLISSLIPINLLLSTQQNMQEITSCFQNET